MYLQIARKEEKELGRKIIFPFFVLNVLGTLSVVTSNTFLFPPEVITSSFYFFPLKACLRLLRVLHIPCRLTSLQSQKTFGNEASVHQAQQQQQQPKEIEQQQQQLAGQLSGNEILNVQCRYVPTIYPTNSIGKITAIKELQWHNFQQYILQFQSIFQLSFFSGIVIVSRYELVGYLLQLYSYATFFVLSVYCSK